MIQNKWVNYQEFNSLCSKRWSRYCRDQKQYTCLLSG